MTTILAVVIITIIIAIKRSQQSIYSPTYDILMYNIFVLGHNINVNDVNTQQNEAYDVIGQFRVNMSENMSYGDITTHRLPVKNNNIYDYVRNSNLI